MALAALASLAPRTLALAFALAATFVTPAAAYRVLHVRALAIAVDRARVRIGQPLHLTVRVAVRERVDALPELILPSLTAFAVLADSERLQRGAQGTVYLASLTITPNLPGRLVIGPAYLDALDPSGHRALRYRSNTVVVTALAAAPVGAPALLARALRVLAAGLGGAVLIGLVLGAGVRAAARRRRQRTAQPQGTAKPPALARPDDLAGRAATLAGWAARLRTQPTRRNATSARAALWSHLAAGERETAGDVAARCTEVRWRRAVAAAERAAFVEPTGEAQAALELADALENACR